MSTVQKEDGVLEIQIGLIFAQMALVLGAGYMTLRVAGKPGNETILTHIRTFSGGVFMGMALIHMLPEAVMDVNEGYPDYHELPYTTFVLGYLMILAIEKVVMDAHAMMHDHGEEGHGGHDHGHGHGQGEDDEGNGTAHSGHGTHRSSVRLSDRERIMKLSGIGASNTSNALSMDGDYVAMPDDPESHGGHNGGEAAVDAGKLTAYVLFFALSFHAIIEGVAIGLQTSFNTMLTLGIGVLLHMWAEGVAIAAALNKANRGFKQSMVLLVMFAAASPVGIIIGIIVSESADALVNGILMSIAAGTFVYVACNEIISEEFETSKHRRSKFCALLMGLLIITIIGLVFPHDHDHGDHGGGANSTTSHDHHH